MLTMTGPAVGSMWFDTDGLYLLVMEVDGSGRAWCAPWEGGQWSIRALVQRDGSAFEDYTPMTE